MQMLMRKLVINWGGDEGEESPEEMQDESLGISEISF